MDVNLNAEIKGMGVPAAPAAAREDRTKPPVAPVAESNDSSKGALDENRLHGQGGGLSPEELSKAMEDAQARLDTMGTRLGLELHKNPDAVVVQVKDRESGELIRQFPPEEILQLRQKLNELVGILFDKKA